MMQLQGKTALVTGAGSGIGRAISISLAKRGCNLALSGLNLDSLRETQMLAGEAVTTSLHVADVTDKQAIAELPKAVMQTHLGVDILVNNAGVALGGNFSEVTDEDFEWVINTNFWGVVRMTRAFLPLLLASQEARLVTISSIFGIISFPGQAAYSASKFAVRAFSNSLRHELAHTRIGVSVVYPGGVKTNIANDARIPASFSPERIEKELRDTNASLIMPPCIAGEIIVKGIEREKTRIVVGKDARLGILLERLFPETYLSVARRFGR